MRLWLAFKGLKDRQIAGPKIEWPGNPAIPAILLLLFLEQSASIWTQIALTL